MDKRTFDIAATAADRCIKIGALDTAADMLAMARRSAATEEDRRRFNALVSRLNIATGT